MHSGGRPVPDAIEERWITMLKAILRESGHSEYRASHGPQRQLISYTGSGQRRLQGFGTPQGISDEVVLSNMGENVVLNVQAAVDRGLAYDVADLGRSWPRHWTFRVGELGTDRSLTTG